MASKTQSCESLCKSRCNEGCYIDILVCGKCKMVLVQNVWCFLFQYFPMLVTWNFKYEKLFQVHIFKASPIMITCTTAKLLLYFYMPIQRGPGVVHCPLPLQWNLFSELVNLWTDVHVLSFCSLNAILVVASML